MAVSVLCLEVLGPSGPDNLVLVGTDHAPAVHISTASGLRVTRNTSKRT